MLLPPSKIESFLQARLMLPDAAGCPRKFLMIWVGRDAPSITFALYCYHDAPNYIFFFYKEWYAGGGEGWQWVCADLLLQEMIHTNRREAMKLLEGAFD